MNVSLRPLPVKIYVLLLAFLPSVEAVQPPPKPGQEVQGLRLSLTVTDSIGGKADDREFRVDLVNVGNKTIELVCVSETDKDRSSYAEFFKHHLAVITSPEVWPETCQTAYSQPKLPEPKCELKPGASLTVSWNAEGHQLKPLPCPWSGPNLLQPGLYRVHVKIAVTTSDGARIDLASNEQDVAAGGSHEMPKHTTGHVIKTNPDKGVATIDLGSGQKIETGDCFRIQYMLLAVWRLCITNVTERSAEGTVELLGRNPGGQSLAFPKEGWRATLLAPKEQKR